jgi:hypothetical protein
MLARYASASVVCARVVRVVRGAASGEADAPAGAKRRAGLQ